MVNVFKTDVTLWIALVHGILAFFSPCVLPLIPAFAGVVLAKGKKLQRLLGFFVGFSVMFTVLGAVSSLIGGFLSTFGPVIEKVIGVVIVALGVLYMLDVQLIKGSGANLWKFKGAGFLGGLLLGGAIGFVWIPCSSPVLGSILLIAAKENLQKGMLLLFVYSLGISLPFLTIGSVLAKALTLGFGKPKWESLVKYVGGVFIIVLGALIFFGKMKV